MALGAESRTPTPSQRPLFPPCGPPGWSEMLFTAAHGETSPVGKFPGKLFLEVVGAAAAPTLPTQIASLEKSLALVTWGRAIAQGRTTGSCGCCPLSPGSHLYVRTAPLSPWVHPPFPGASSRSSRIHCRGLIPAKLSSAGRRG